MAGVLNGSLPVGEIKFSSEWRPLVPLPAQTPSAPIRHGVGDSYLTSSLPTRSAQGVDMTITQEVYLSL